MSKIFQFGQKIDDYDFLVINERDARASAGIMFLLGTLSLFSFILTKNLFWANLFTITFIIEFIVRVFINPIYAPYMVLGSLIVSNQEPDWVEARPKKFAWILGVILGLIMSYFILFNILTPARLLTCLLCLFLLYMESVFGICIGCLIYKRLNIKLYKCAGGVCEVPSKKRSILPKFAIILLYIGLFYGVFLGLKNYKYQGFTTSHPTQEQLDDREFSQDDTETNTPAIKPDIVKTKAKDKCTPPQWAIDMRHKEMWLEHHGCK